MYRALLSVLSTIAFSTRRRLIWLSPPARKIWRDEFISIYIILIYIYIILIYIYYINIYITYIINI